MLHLNTKYALIFGIGIRLLDVLTLILAGQIASLIHFGTTLEATSSIHLSLLYFCSFLSFISFEKMGIYSSWRGRRPSKMLINITLSWGLVLALGILFSYVTHRSYDVSRMWLLYWFFTGSLSIATLRWLVHWFLRKMRERGLNIKRVIIVGYGAIGKELQRRAETQNWFGYEIVGIYAEPKDRASLAADKVTNFASLEEIPKFIENNRVHEVWISLSLNAAVKPQDLQYLLRNVLVDIRWIPDLISIHMLSNKVMDFLGFPTIDLNQPISNGLAGISKDIFDRLFALSVLILLSPLFLMIALAIRRESPGPIFFRQYRHGLNGKLFQVYKFRSMKLHTEDRELKQATKNDDRVTPLGQFLRRTSLDELPQFINVLQGDMSIVGPRPHALQHNNFYKGKIEQYMLRHRVKPGITGWAQIHGLRGETDTLDKMAERVKFDLYYIKHWSFWMDLKIIIWTAFRGWTGTHAY
jgi:putative colanic acid biosynthesis UDP-glucose lipid carrier transferase